MTDRPIIFSAPMVRALIDGRKSQTRRVINPQPRIRPELVEPEIGPSYWAVFDGDCEAHRVPVRYAIGDRLYVREHWRCSAQHDATAPRDLIPRSMTIAFEAGGSIANQDSRDDWHPSEASYTDADWMGRRRPGIHMPRWASRLTLIVTDVRVERLQDISEEDAKAEGVGIDQVAELDCGDISGVRSVSTGIFCSDHRDAMRETWSKIHGPGAWDENPWVCAISFTVHRQNIDAMKEGAK